MKQLGSGEPQSMPAAPSVFLKVKASFTLSGSKKSIPLVIGILHTRLVVPAVNVDRDEGQ